MIERVQNSMDLPVIGGFHWAIEIETWFGIDFWAFWGSTTLI